MDPNEAMRLAEEAIDESRFADAKAHLNEVIAWIRDRHGFSPVWIRYPKATDLLIREWCMEVRPLLLFHGTSAYAGEKLLTTVPFTKERSYANGREGFSCTTVFKVAEAFAVRQSPMGLLDGDYTGAGVVLEYILCPAVEDFTYLKAKDGLSMRDEHEALVLDPTRLIIQAVHRLDDNGDWQRQAVEMRELAKDVREF